MVRSPVVTRQVGDFRAFSARLRGWLAVCAVAAWCVACNDESTLEATPDASARNDDGGGAPSTFFVGASIEQASSVDLPSTGDLWPSCSANGVLYAAWGDGFGFDPSRAEARPDIGLAAIMGSPWLPGSLAGVNRVTDRRATQNVFRVWTTGPYYQKPTGLACRRGKLYLAVQDLNYVDYGDAPAATLAVSEDEGRSWHEGATPLWNDHVFTTVMFLDYGESSAGDGYLYAYGLDHNWAWSASKADPEALYLARVAERDDPLDPMAWYYFSGFAASGAPRWSNAIDARQPVLVDCTRRYAGASDEGMSVIAQGSVVYDAPLRRYLYLSWTEYTYEFYEAPAPWGPWQRFLHEDFGPYPWSEARFGGYGTTAPAAWISADGRELWLQSNTWASGVNRNNFSLRKLRVEPAP